MRTAVPTNEKMIESTATNFPRWVTGIRSAGWGGRKKGEKGTEGAESHRQSPVLIETDKGGGSAAAQEGGAVGAAEHMLSGGRSRSVKGGHAPAFAPAGPEKMRMDQNVQSSIRRRVLRTSLRADRAVTAVWQNSGGGHTRTDTCL